jgi:CheY-like chemotaxis protein
VSANFILLVAGLMEMHGGHIGALSDGEGKGSTFYIDLPLHPVFDEVKINIESLQSHNLNLFSSVSESESLFLSSPKEPRHTTPLSRMGIFASIGKEEPALHRFLSSPVTFTNGTHKLASGWSPHRIQPSMTVDDVHTFHPVSEIVQHHPPSSFSLVNGVNQEGILRWENGLRFLIVDDTLTNRKVMKKLLTSLGHSVEEAVDGLDFLTKMNKGNNWNNSNHKVHNQNLIDSGGVSEVYFESTPLHLQTFDVILMDDNMPNMSGPEATGIIREQGYRGLIFGVTGNAFEEQIKNFVIKGANAVFSKPLDLNKLRESIESNLS